MPAAYVVLSHTAPAQVQRLVAAIRRSSPTASVVVVHDDRAEPPIDPPDPLVHVRSHGLATDWGSWELVEATLEGLRWARDLADPEVTAVVSGQCYPVRPLAEWERAFLEHGGWQGTARPLRYRARWGSAPGQGDDELTRYTYRWLRVPVVDRVLRGGGPPARVAWAVARRTEPAVSLRNVARGRGAYLGVRRLRSTAWRDAPIHLGSQWFAVDRAHRDALLRDLAPGTPLHHLFRRSLIADEAAPQTVLARSRPPHPALPVSHSVWLPEADTTRTFTIDDLASVLASGSPFCRKVDPVASSDLLDALDHVNAVTT